MPDEIEIDEEASDRALDRCAKKWANRTEAEEKAELKELKETQESALRARKAEARARPDNR